MPEQAHATVQSYVEYLVVYTLDDSLRDTFEHEDRARQDVAHVKEALGEDAYIVKRTITEERI